MANRMTLIMMVLYFCLSTCKSSNQDSEIPNCIKDRIETLKRQPIQNPPAEVWQWETNDKTFYYFNAPCCDQFSTLYNDKCEIICAPDGGFTGKGDGKCPDFGTDVKRILIWKDERKS